MVKAEAIQMMHNGKLMYHPGLDCGWVTIQNGRFVFSNNKIWTLRQFRYFTQEREFDEGWVDAYPIKKNSLKVLINKLDFRAYMLLLLLIILLIVRMLLY